MQHRRQDEDGRISRCVTPAGHLSRVSLHPTFTDTMSLRSLVRCLFQPPSFSTRSFAIEGLSWKILVMGFHSGDTASPPRHLHRSRLIFLPDRSFAVDGPWDPLSPLCRHNRNQWEFLRIARHTKRHHVELNDLRRTCPIFVRIADCSASRNAAVIRYIHIMCERILKIWFNS